MCFSFKKKIKLLTLFVLSKIQVSEFNEGGSGRYLALAMREGNLDDVVSFPGLHMD